MAPVAVAAALADAIVTQIRPLTPLPQSALFRLETGELTLWPWLASSPAIGSIPRMLRIVRWA